MKPAVLLACAALVATGLAGCDEPKPRNPPPPRVAVAAAPAVAERLPAWARDLVGKPLASLYPEAAGICVGNTDNVQARFPAPAPGVEIVGWGWDPGARAPIARILLVDSAGLVAGAGEPGIARPDVTAARPEVTSPTTGWSAFTERTTGAIDAFGVVVDGKAVCRLGRVELG